MGGRPEAFSRRGGLVTPAHSQFGIQRHYPWQTECPCKRRLDNYKVVEWAVAAKELGFPKQTDGKRMVKEWRASRSPSAPSLPVAQTRVITR